MPRREIKISSRRKQLMNRTDYLFNSTLMLKLINLVMYSGKKYLAEKTVYDALDIVCEKVLEDRPQIEGIQEYMFNLNASVNDVRNSEQMRFFAIKLLEIALDIIGPSVELRPRRIGGATYQVPVNISSKRKTSLSIRWLVNCSRDRSERNITSKLAGELCSILITNKSESINKKNNMQKMAAANKAFSYFINVKQKEHHDE